MNFLYFMKKIYKYQLKQFILLFLCCVLSVSLLFAYASLVHNDALVVAIGNQHMMDLIRVTQVVMAIFMVSLVNYAISNFMNQQKKDLALMKMLGVDDMHLKRTYLKYVGLLLLVAMSTGISLGCVMSYAFYLVFKHILDYEMLAFHVSFKSFGLTSGSFGLVFGLTWLRVHKTLDKVSPILLMKESRVKIKEGRKTFFSLGMILLCVIFLQLFNLKTRGMTSPIQMTGIHYFLMILMVLPLVVNNVIAFVFHVLKQGKNIKARYLPTVSVLRIIYPTSRKIIYALIILSTMVIMLFSTVLSTYQNVEATIDNEHPYDVVMISQEDHAFQFPDMNQVENIESFEFKKSVETILDDRGSSLFEARDALILSHSTYKRLTGNDPELDDQAYFSHLNDLYEGIPEELPYSQSSFSTDHAPILLDFKGQSRSPLINVGSLESKFFIVVSDPVYETMGIGQPYYATLVKTPSLEDGLVIQQHFDQMVGVDILTKYEAYRLKKQETGTRVFIVLSTGLLFSMALYTISILKLLSELEVHLTRQKIMGWLGQDPNRSHKRYAREVLAMHLIPVTFGAFIGYLFTMINSLGTPMHGYFGKDILIFVACFLLVTLMFNLLVIRKISRHYKHGIKGW